MYAPDSPIGAGDRAPDFSLPDRSGAPINLYTRVRGGTPVVMFYPDVASFSSEVAALQRAMERVPLGGVDLFVVVRASADALPEVTYGTIFVVADATGQAVKSYGFAADAGPLALRFDPNLRLTALRAAGAGQEPLTAVVLPSSEAPPEELARALGAAATLAGARTVFGDEWMVQRP